jgi:hypothetical protein
VQHRDTGKLRILKHEIVHIRRPAPPVPDNENGRLDELMTTNRNPESESFKDPNGNCGDDEQGNPERSQAMARLDLIAISPQQRQPIAQRGEVQNVRKSHPRFISSHESRESC